MAEISEQQHVGSFKLPSKGFMKQKPSDSFDVDDEDEFSEAKKTKKQRANVRCELDHYLDGDMLPDNSEFDVLGYWKKYRKYPTLRKIARDILVIHISTVASESTFGMSGTVIGPHRCRLHAKTMEASMCLQNWMTEDVKGNANFLHYN